MNRHKRHGSIPRHSGAAPETDPDDATLPGFLGRNASTATRFVPFSLRITLAVAVIFLTSTSVLTFVGQEAAQKLVAASPADNEETPAAMEGAPQEGATAEISSGLSPLEHHRLVTLGTALLVAAASILATAGFARHTSRPLRELLRAARRVARGDLTTRVHIERRDEIGLLAAGFNHMVSRQQDHRRRLEREVAARTRDLVRANRELEVAHRAAQQLARTDSLTGLANRRALEERLDMLVAEGRRGRAFSLILLDLDHFKRINDEHGHETGDEVLRTLAGKLERRTRRMDLVARFGGEELAVLLPDADLASAADVADNLRRTVENCEPGGLRVTASFGVATFGGHLSDRESLIRAADQALYRAKALGRNRVVRLRALGLAGACEQDPSAVA